MLQRTKEILSAINYSLPVQLLVIQVRRYQTLLILWILVIGVVTGALGKGMGILYTFLEPEYMGKVSFWSMYIVGASIGAFTFAYMITLYINESYRFHFIAFTRSPFFTFSLNNFFLPSLFLGVLFYRFCRYLILTYGQLDYNNTLKLVGFVLGVATVFLLFASYFFATNKNLFKAFGETIHKEMEKAKIAKSGKVIIGKARKEMQSRHRVDYFLDFPFRISETQKLGQVEFRKLVRVLNQNHGNLLFLMVTVLGVVMMFGLLDEKPFFQIPAAASVMLTFSLFILISGALTFWVRKAGLAVFMVILLFAWFYPAIGFLHERNLAFGLNYQTTPAAFTYEHIESLSDDITYRNDRKETIDMLNNWKRKYQRTYGRYKKPKAVFVSTSGGGLRAAYWTMQVMQEVDSLTEGEISHNIRLMSGASGGMLGLAYFRELYLRSLTGEIQDLTRPEYRENIGQDLLNRIIYKAITDIFLPNNKVRIGEKTYDKERGYSFDSQMEVNMPELKGKLLGDYAEYERSGEIPVMILSPAILNNARKLYIASTGVSFLARPDPVTSIFATRSPGVEFRRLFAEQEADSLSFSTALRMNATFPFVLPIVELPSEPVIEVMDAGAIDNYGTVTGIRYLYEFREWFAENTESVIFLQIRDNERIDPIEKTTQKSAFRKMLRPLGSGYNSGTEAKDIANDQMLALVEEWYDGRIEVVTFEYPHETSKQPASLSFHLTELEKQNIHNSVNTEHNRKNFEFVEMLYKDELLARQSQ